LTAGDGIEHPRVGDPRSPIAWQETEVLDATTIESWTPVVARVLGADPASIYGTRGAVTDAHRFEAQGHRGAVCRFVVPAVALHLFMQDTALGVMQSYYRP
jgi:hypothetical protein